MTEESPFARQERIVDEQFWPLVKAGKIEESLALLDDMIAHPPVLAAVLVLKAVLLQQLNRLEEALTCYDLVLGKQNQSSMRPYAIPDRGMYDARVRRAELLERLGREEEALAAYGEALVFDEKDLFPHTSRGRLLAHLKRYPEALDAFERALALARQPGAALVLPFGYHLMNVANVLSSLGRNREALLLYTQAEQDGRVEGALRRALQFNLACTLAQLGRYEKAVHLLRAVIEADPANVFAFFAKGEVERALGREAEAEATYQRLAESVPAEAATELPALRQQVGQSAWESRVYVPVQYKGRGERPW